MPHGSNEWESGTPVSAVSAGSNPATTSPCRSETSSRFRDPVLSEIRPPPGPRPKVEVPSEITSLLSPEYRKPALPALLSRSAASYWYERVPWVIIRSNASNVNDSVAVPVVRDRSEPRGL